MEPSFPSERNHVPNIYGEKEEECSKTQNNYKEIISTLSRNNGWKSFEDLCYYQGFWHFPTFLEGVISAQQHFKAQPTDIFVCSLLKAGTTWLKALTFAIVTRTRFDESTNPLLTTISHKCVPFLEIEVVQNPNNRNPEFEFPLIATHIPYPSLPKSITSLGCKIVYICRDPKDVFVSTWHFLPKIYNNGQDPVPLEVAFELFCEGVTIFGPYWEHVLGYYKASLEWPERVLFIKYEDMIRDTNFYVQKMANFMGYPFSLEEEREGAVEKITKLCSFENLSNLEINKNGKYHPAESLPIENRAFFRNGKVGDWQNYLTAEMVEHMDQITEEKLGDLMSNHK